MAVAATGIGSRSFDDYPSHTTHSAGHRKFNEIQTIWKTLLHMDWSFTHHTSVPDEQESNIFLQSNEDPRKLSDIIRLQKIYQYGGVYVDMDFGREHAPKGSVIFGMEDDSVVSNSFIAAPRHHPFIAFLLTNIERWSKLFAGERTFLQTGPHFITAAVRAVEKHNRSEMKVYLLPSTMTNPIHFSLLEGRGQSVIDVVKLLHRQRIRCGTATTIDTSNVLMVQGWASQLMYVPTKIKILNVQHFHKKKSFQINIQVFPWIGAIVDIENHNWSICVSEIVANAAAPTCVKLQMRREQYLEHITGSTCM